MTVSSAVPCASNVTPAGTTTRERMVGVADSHSRCGGIRVGRHLHRHHPDARHAAVGSTGQRGVFGWRHLADAADGKPRIVAVDVAVSGRSRHRAERNILEK